MKWPLNNMKPLKRGQYQSWIWNNTFTESASWCFVWTALKRTWKTLIFCFMLISAKATKMPAKTGSRALILGNLHFLFLQHVLTHVQMGKFAPYQPLSLPNIMSTHVSLFYHAYIKLSVILRKRMELLRNRTYEVMDVHHRSRFLFSLLNHFHLKKEIE